MPKDQTSTEGDNAQQPTDEGLSRIDLLADAELVSRQLMCVHQLCDNLSKIAATNQKLLLRCALKAPGMIEHHGAWTGEVMEFLCDVLNGMDAVDESQAAHWRSTFEEMRRRKWNPSLVNSKKLITNQSQRMS
jgi:hypothetical protein